MRNLHRNLGMIFVLVLFLTLPCAHGRNGLVDQASPVDRISSDELEKLPEIRDLSAVLNLVVPTGDYGESFGTGVGLGIRGRVAASDRVRFTTGWSMNMIGGAEEFPNQDYSQISSEIFERVEVLLAPQGTLYGSASGGFSAFAGAGVVNFTQKLTFDQSDYKFYETKALYNIGARYDLPAGDGAIGLEASFNGTISENKENWFNASVNYSRNIRHFWTDNYRHPTEAWGEGKFTVGGGLGCGWQVGDFGRGVGNSLQLGAKGAWVMNDRIRPTLSLRYQKFANQGLTDNDNAPDISAIFVDAGIELDFRPIVKTSDTYLSLAVTPTFLKYNLSTPNFNESQTETKVDLTLGAGWRAPLSRRISLDLHTGIPVMGGIFRSDDHVQQVRTEALVMLTPKILR